LRLQLSLHNIEILESESVEDPELLMHMMEAHEALEDARDQAQVDALRSSNMDQLTAVVSELAGAFERRELEKAKGLTVKLRYYTNIEGACKDWTEGKPVVLQH
jgi:molecular chaperone HscB